MSFKGQKSVNRNRLDIVRDMLAIASTKVKKTRIMYQANLSFLQVEKYMKTLLDEGLLTRDGNGGTSYLTTEKGKEFLRLYDDYLARCRDLVDEVDGANKQRTQLESMCFNTKEEANQKKILKDTNRDL